MRAVMAQSVHRLSYELDDGGIVFFFSFPSGGIVLLLDNFRIDSSATLPYVQWVPRIISLGITANGV